MYIGIGLIIVSGAVTFLFQGRGLHPLSISFFIKGDEKKIKEADPRGEGRRGYYHQEHISHVFKDCMSILTRGVTRSDRYTAVYHLPSLPSLILIDSTQVHCSEGLALNRHHTQACCFNDIRMSPCLPLSLSSSPLTLPIPLTTFIHYMEPTNTNNSDGGDCCAAAE